MAIIKVLVETESGDVLRETANMYVLERFLQRAHGGDDYPLIRYIDPYGDTVFNRLQIPQLLAEWRLMRASQDINSEEGKALDELEALGRYALNEPHLYLRFFGD